MKRPTDVTLRSATAEDQATIKAIVHEAGINPRNLDWPNFLIAEDTTSKQVVGIGQVKPHDDGTRELASIAVIPDRQGQGIARMIIEALLARESGILYLICEHANQGLYERFDFVPLQPGDMPRDLRKLWRMVRLAQPALRLAYSPDFELVVMRRDAPLK
ncbi:MAG TPA: GNAT family N-acetyltransferase [Aggregatilineales bacterium]|nr:GNAT family N-acetyltransferase [Aggregatilineales bacterium]